MNWGFRSMIVLSSFVVGCAEGTGTDGGLDVRLGLDVPRPPADVPVPDDVAADGRDAGGLADARDSGAVADARDTGSPLDTGAMADAEMGSDAGAADAGDRTCVDPEYDEGTSTGATVLSGSFVPGDEDTELATADPPFNTCLRANAAGYRFAERAHGWTAPRAGRYRIEVTSATGGCEYWQPWVSVSPSCAALIRGDTAPSVLCLQVDSLDGSTLDFTSAAGQEWVFAVGCYGTEETSLDFGSYQVALRAL
jgi:hypothetical protein